MNASSTLKFPAESGVSMLEVFEAKTTAFKPWGLLHHTEELTATYEMLPTSIVTVTDWFSVS